jgi:hypothetical protein
VIAVSVIAALIALAALAQGVRLSPRQRSVAPLIPVFVIAAVMLATWLLSRLPSGD